MPAPLSPESWARRAFPNYRQGTILMMVHSGATTSTTFGDEGPSSLGQSLALFIIRRRILLSNILFVALVAVIIAGGVRPRDLFDVRDPWTAGGVGLVALGVALRSWAAGILLKDRELTTTGPYALIRNPLYVGSFLMLLGFCILLNAAHLVWLILLPLLALYVVKVRQEEQLLARLFPSDWPGYMQRTPRFLPWPRRVSLAAEWSAAQWTRSREYQALLTSIAALVAIAIWHAMSR
jgi:protein-S-isoprenylcysteine O-methyltransferase Ste14